MSLSRWISLFYAVISFGFVLPASAQQPVNVNVNITQAWTDTGITVTSGQQLSILAGGNLTWGTCPGCDTTPTGDPWSDCSSLGPPANPAFVAPGLACWSLIGKIGSGGAPFQVGTYLNTPASASGELYLGVNDNIFTDNSGGWLATIDQNAKSLGGCPCERSYQGVLPSSSGDPTNPGSGTDAGSGPSGYPSGGGSGGGNSPSSFRSLTNRNAGGVGTRALTGNFSVDTASGNLFYEDTDYTTAGQNPLAFSRFYNSRAPVSGAPTLAGSIGTNWRTAYDRYLQLSASKVIAERADGQQLVFTLTSGVWKSDSDVDLTLSEKGSTWTLTDHGDTQETYTAITSATALLASVTARNGYTQTLEYNSSHQLASVKDSYSRSLSFTYNSTGTLETMTTPDGTVITYGYTTTVIGGYNLTSVAYPTSPASIIQYIYHPAGVQPHQLWGVTDEDGNPYLTWNYDLYGHIVNSHLGSAAFPTTYAFNDNGTTTITNPLGISDTYSFSMLQGTPKITQISRAATATTAAATETFGYDGNGYLSNFTDWNGNKTSYTNNAQGDPTTISEAVGTAAVRTTTISHDPVWIHLPDTVTTAGLTASYTYDGNGNVLTRTLKDTTTATVPYATAGQTRKWTNSWSNFLLASVANPKSDTTKFTYTSSGALASITDALGRITTITGSTAGGLPKTIVDPNGVTTTLAYDDRQRLISSTISGSGGAFTTDYTVDANGLITKVTLPDNSYLAYTYVHAHLLAQTEDALGNSIANSWDGLDDLVQVNTLASGSTTPVREHSATFDAIGRRLTDVGGAGQTTTFTYDKNGNALTIKDGDGHTTTNVYDALNRLTRSTDANGGVTSFAYDTYNRPTSVTDADGHATSYVYDGFGEVIQQISPDSGTTVYHYDADGNLTQKLDASGVTTNYTYDSLDRPLTTTYPADATENIKYTYDQTGHGFGIGRLTSVTDAVGILNRTYDERGNLLTEKRTHGAVSLATTYTYDAASRIASITYPSGNTITYSRDAAGQVTKIGTPTATVASNITHLPFGPVSGFTFGNGVADTRSFDADYRMTALSDTNGSAAIQSLTYAYDLANNLTSTKDTVHTGNSQAIGYDTLNRLASATAADYGTFTYTYDKVGNRLTEGRAAEAPTNDYSYVAGTNRLSTLSISGATIEAFTYTPTGNIVDFMGAGEPTVTLNYNKANRVGTIAKSGAQIVQYLYDGFGQRLVKTFAGTPVAGVLFDYSQDGSLLEETNLSGAAQADYIYLDGMPIGDYAPGSKTLYYLHTDHLGTPQLATNNAKAIEWQATYEPFGWQNTVSGTITQNLRLPGQYFDSETTSYHNGFRDYVAILGRYGQSDPIGLGGGVNTYAYANGNPGSFTDPTGTNPAVATACALAPEACAAPAAVAAAAAAVVGTGYLCYRAGLAIYQHFNDEVPPTPPGSGSDSGSSSGSGSGSSSGSGSMPDVSGALPPPGMVSDPTDVSGSQTQSGLPNNKPTGSGGRGRGKSLY